MTTNSRVIIIIEALLFSAAALCAGLLTAGGLTSLGQHFSYRTFALLIVGLGAAATGLIITASIHGGFLLLQALISEDEETQILTKTDGWIQSVVCAVLNLPVIGFWLTLFAFLLIILFKKDQDESRLPV